MATNTERRASSWASEQEGKTWLNALVGAIVTFVGSFLPFVGLLAPIIGGAVAGYLQRHGTGEGGKVGAVSGAIASIPVLGVFVLVFGFLGMGMMFSGEFRGPALAGGIMFLVAVFVIGLTILASALGGLIGGAIAGSSTPTTHTADSQTRIDTFAEESAGEGDAVGGEGTDREEVGVPPRNVAARANRGRVPGWDGSSPRRPSRR